MKQVDVQRAALNALLDRRSVSPRRLGAPGLSDEQIELVIEAALRSPDHGALTPWRALHIPPQHRRELARLFAEEKLRRDPLASADDLERARAHATDAPMLLAFFVCIRSAVTVPAGEQWLAAGAALGNILNAIHALGFGAIILSGDRCSDDELAHALGLRDSEKLACFISAGTVLRTPPAATRKPVDRVLTTWCGPGGSAAKPPQVLGKNPMGLAAQ